MKVANKGDTFDVPEGWKIIEMNEDNFGEFIPRVGHLITPDMAEGMEGGTIKFIWKM